MRPGSSRLQGPESLCDVHAGKDYATGNTRSWRHPRRGLARRIETDSCFVVPDSVRNRNFSFERRDSDSNSKTTQ